MKASLFAKGNKRTLEKLLELRRKAMADKTSRVLLRIEGVILSLERISISDIADRLHVNRSSVHVWITLWNQYGVQSLNEGYRSGRPRLLSDEEKEKLKDILKRGPLAYGLDTGAWTSPLIAGIIHENFGVKYHPGHVRKLVRTLGYSAQHPASGNVQAAAKKQKKWVRYSCPNLKKKGLKKGK